ncbi:unnamed protein product [Haemonchus placei]|uniref:Peptidase_M16_C domain-containing protein n=1 Tax=Haemonchus placei TaxID=6290 RepID=A0A0N4X8Z0_HAEPC|nr:unnamed protein product [Haemonchus placei]
MASDDFADQFATSMKSVIMDVGREIALKTAQYKLGYDISTSFTLYENASVTPEARSKLEDELIARNGDVESSLRYHLSSPRFATAASCARHRSLKQRRTRPI